MTIQATLTWRRCAKVVNSLHSICYFAPDLDGELGTRGIADPMACYLAARAAPLGPAGPGVVTAAFNAFSYRLVAQHLPGVWETVPPTEILAIRRRSAGTVLRRLLGAEVAASKDLSEAAVLAQRASEAGTRPGRPMYAANADLETPDEPLLALWHASTLLREHRGDSHVVALGHAELTGIEALVADCASPMGMPKELVMTKRGWTGTDWAAAEERLRDRGLMDARGALTTAGLQLREDVEHETDRLDRLPYEHLGDRAAVRLEDITGRLVSIAADAGAFPPILRGFFIDPR